MIKIAKDLNAWKPIDEIIILGDFGDFYWLSMHARLPEHFDIECTLSDEIFSIKMRLKELRDLFPNAKITYLMGNHEFRLDRYIVNKCAEMFEFLKMSELLLLKEYGVKPIPYGKSQKYKVLGSNLMARHEPISMGEYCSGGTANKAKTSIVFGHTHRVQTFTTCDMWENEINCYSLGWLGNRNSPAVQFIRGMETWAHAFGYAQVYKKDHFLDVIRIKNYKAICNGKVYK